MDIRGKTLLLTGATGGIGQAVAQALAEAGARLLLTARDSQALANLQQQLPGSGHTVLAADLTDSQARQQLLDAARQLKVDGLINNAGTNQLILQKNMSEVAIDRTLTLNLTIPMMLCSSLLPHLRTRPSALIVNVGSILGSIGMPGSVTYCASKFGLRGFSEALRRELADTDIQVVYFAPRMTATTINSDAMISMNRELGTAVDTPEAVARQLLKVLARRRPHNHFLGWPEKFFVRLNGVFPRLVDKALRGQLPTIKFYALEGKQ